MVEVIDVDARAAYTANWRTARLWIEGTCTVEEVRALRAAQGDRCAYCPLELEGAGELDHFMPVARGGSSRIENLRWACTRCNALKSD